jgi:[acyl-carrier-protein] S-malonyltransferase
MGKDLFENFTVAREIFEEASDAIRINLKKLCFEGPDSDLTLTENTQPCLLVTSVAAFRVAEKEFGFAPGAVAGHSLGEYSALVAIGSLPLSAAVYWVRERGQAMQKAVPLGEGTMAAILGVEDKAILSLCKKATDSALQKRAGSGDSHPLSVEAICEPANYNSPGQIVIAGSTDGIAEAIQLVKTDSEF